jgi:hypothetical protein
MNGVCLALVLGQLGGLGVRGAKDTEAQLRLTLTSDDKGVQLFQVLSSSVGAVTTGQGTYAVGFSTFRRVCQVPCGKFIEGTGSDFFFGGDGVTPSSLFTLLDRSGDLTIQVDAGSSALRVLGFVSTVLGISVFVPSVLLYALLPTSSSLSGMALGGTVGGALLTGVGIPLIAFSGTSFEILPAKPLAVPAKPDEMVWR